MSSLINYLLDVEDGHVLHLVVKQQVAPSSDSSPNQGKT